MSVKWDDLVNEGRKKVEKRGGRPDFVLKFDGEPDVVVKFPDGQRSMDYEEAQSGKQQLRILLGRDFSRVWEKFRGVPVETLTALIQRMWDHWDDEGDQVPGGKEDSGI